MPVKGGPNIRTSQAIVWLDAADKSSYPGSGTTWVNSVTPGTYNGTLTNTSFNSTDALGALFFSGSNTFADMGNIGAISASYTFQVAVKPLPTGSPYTILSYTSGSGTGSVTFRLDYSSSIQTAVFSAFASSGSVNKTYNLSTVIPTGSWSILHGRFGDTTLSLFKNGSIVSSTFITGSTVGYSSNNKFLVGGVSQFTGSYLSGSVANVAVYNASLNSYFISTNYNGLATRFGLPTITTSNADDNVQAFIEAAGIIDPTEISAITTLVTNLKAYNIWDKMKAIYPMVGGTATSQKYNLKNPNTFIGEFVGGWTHSSTGALPNGVNAYMDTTLTPNGNLSQNDAHVSLYSRTNNMLTSGQIDMGCGNSGGGNQDLYLSANYGPGINAISNINGSGYAAGSSNTTSLGFFLSQRTAVTTTNIYQNNSVIKTHTEVSTTPSSSPIYLGRNSSSEYSSRELAFVSVGASFDAIQRGNLYTAVQAFQTTLSRQV